MRKKGIWFAFGFSVLALSAGTYGCGEHDAKRFERKFRKLVDQRADREEFRSRLGLPHSASSGERNCWLYTDNEHYAVSVCFEPETGRFLAEEALVLDRKP